MDNPPALTHDPATGLDVDIYPVGVLDDLQGAYRTARHAGRYRDAYRKLRSCVRRLAENARAGEWRSLRNSFNGYLAEPPDFPEELTRCGNGWTRAAALRSLRRHYRRDRGGNLRLLCLIRHRWDHYRTVSYSIGMIAHLRCLRCSTETTAVINNRGRWL